MPRPPPLGTTPQLAVFESTPASISPRSAAPSVQFSSRPSLVPSVTVVRPREGRRGSTCRGALIPHGCGWVGEENLVPRLLAGAEAGRVPRACLRDLRCHEREKVERLWRSVSRARNDDDWILLNYG